MKEHLVVQKSSFVEVRRELMPTISEALISEDGTTPEKSSSR
jgi:hypothetical protein